MENRAQEPLKEQLRIDTHFESLKGKILSETLDILASMISDYIDKEGKSEED